MSVSISSPGMPAIRSTTLDLELFQADQTLLAHDRDETKEGNRSIIYDYNVGTSFNTPREVRHSTTSRANSLRTEISLAGPYVSTDSVTGKTTPIANRTWGIYTIQPVGVLELTPALLQGDLEFVFSLFFPSVASGAASDATIKKILAGSRIW